MKTPDAASMLTVPFAVLVETLKVKMSLSASVAVTLPVTTPVEALGVPTLGFPALGAEFNPGGAITTDTAAVALPPYPSVIVTVNESALSAAGAPALAALARAAAVGV